MCYLRTDADAFPPIVLEASGEWDQKLGTRPCAFAHRGFAPQTFGL